LPRKEKEVRNIEEEWPPQSGNTSLTLTMGPTDHPTNFVFSSPHHRYAERLQQLMMLLPELESRICPESELYGGEGLNVRSVAADTTATESDGVILCNCSAGPITVSLFSATREGRTLIIAKTDATANAVTVEPFGADHIELGTSLTLSTQFRKAILVSDGVYTWLNIGTNTV
jgi:hypothetical protein